MNGLHILARMCLYSNIQQMMYDWLAILLASSLPHKDSFESELACRTK